MRRLSLTTEQRKRLVGRLSDGSDHVEVIDNVSTARVLDDNGQVYEFEFDHIPTDDELAAALPTPVDIDPTATVGRARLRLALQEAAQAAFLADWLNAKVQADATATGAQKNGAALAASNSYARARTLAGRFFQAT